MPFGSLWLPVIASGIAVFIVSSILHMALRYHRADYRKLPNEEAFRAAFGKQNPGPGLYVVPHCGEMKDMAKPEMVEKYQQGPVAIVTLLPTGMPKMPKYLALWFGFSLLVSFLVAYVARHALHAGTSPMEVMRITGAIAFGCYGFSNITDSIWKGQPWGNTVRALIDAALYAVTTGVVFRLLWPSA